MCPDPANNTVQPEGLGPLIADDSTSDYDSESLASSTQSLTDSIREHVYENGRRYHRKSQGQYAMPTDEAEQDRLDLVSPSILCTVSVSN